MALALSSGFSSGRVSLKTGGMTKSVSQLDGLSRTQLPLMSRWIPPKPSKPPVLGEVGGFTLMDMVENERACCCRGCLLLLVVVMHVVVVNVDL